MYDENIIQIFRDGVSRGKDENGEYVEVYVQFIHDFGKVLAKDLDINNGYVNEGIIKYYSELKDIDINKAINIEIFYFEEDEDGYDRFHGMTLNLSSLCVDTRMTLINYIRKYFR
jgi:hypothetical protein